MKIVRKDVPVSTIERLADEHDLTMEVFERGKGTNPNARYFAHFKDAEMQDGGCLVSTFGDGPTPEDAIAAYAIRISEETLVIGAYKEGRREIKVPRLLSDRAFAALESGVSRPGETK